MLDFKVGDTVKVIDKGAACFGETGTVRTIEETTKTVNGAVVSVHTVYDVFFLHRNNGPVHFDPPQLEKVE